MEVILTRDVDNVGIKNEVVKVKDGFARNYLFKNKLAIVASAGNRKNLERQIQRAQELREKRLSEARLLAERLSKLSLKITKKAGKEGKLYGSVTSQEVADLLEATSGNAIDKRKLVLPHHLKTVGNYSLTLKLEPGVSAEIKLEVLGDDEVEAETKEKKAEPKAKEEPKAEEPAAEVAEAEEAEKVEEPATEE